MASLCQGFHGEDSDLFYFPFCLNKIYLLSAKLAKKSFHHLHNSFLNSSKEWEGYSLMQMD